MNTSLLQVHNLEVQFRVRRGAWGRHTMLRAVAGVTLEVRAHEALGVVGESGSGKSTLARAIVNLIAPAAGRIVWSGSDVAALSGAAGWWGSTGATRLPGRGRSLVLYDLRRPHALPTHPEARERSARFRKRR